MFGSFVWVLCSKILARGVGCSGGVLVGCVGWWLVGWLVGWLCGVESGAVVVLFRCLW